MKLVTWVTAVILAAAAVGLAAGFGRDLCAWSDHAEVRSRLQVQLPGAG